MADPHDPQDPHQRHAVGRYQIGGIDDFPKVCGVMGFHHHVNVAHAHVPRLTSPRPPQDAGRGVRVTRRIHTRPENGAVLQRLYDALLLHRRARWMAVS